MLFADVHNTKYDINYYFNINNIIKMCIVNITRRGSRRVLASRSSGLQYYVTFFGIGTYL